MNYGIGVEFNPARTDSFAGMNEDQTFDDQSIVGVNCI